MSQKQDSTISYKCTACARSIKTLANAKQHPLLGCLVCRECHNIYGDGDFQKLWEDGVDELGDDNYCRWCCDGGDLYCCMNEDGLNGEPCHYSFCKDCIQRNVPNDPVLRPENLPNIEWHCPSCDTSKLAALRCETMKIFQHLARNKRPKISNQRIALQSLEPVSTLASKEVWVRYPEIIQKLAMSSSRDGLITNAHIPEFRYHVSKKMRSSKYSLQDWSGFTLREILYAVFRNEYIEGKYFLSLCCRVTNDKTQVTSKEFVDLFHALNMKQESNGIVEDFIRCTYVFHFNRFKMMTRLLEKRLKTKNLAIGDFLRFEDEELICTRAKYLKLRKQVTNRDCSRKRRARKPGNLPTTSTEDLEFDQDLLEQEESN